MSIQGVPSQIERPTTLDSIGGIPLRWFHEIDVACDRFFADRGITWEKADWRQDIRVDMKVARIKKARKS